MDIQTAIDIANNSVYPAQALVALVGVYHVLVLFTRIGKKRFRNRSAAEAFFVQSEDALAAGQVDELAATCDTPAYWHKAVPQLMQLALAQPQLAASALRRLLAERFERDVLADFDHRLSWINTVVKTAPMLGLLGTVLGMISAFGKIAQTQKGGSDPSLLANDISFALITTAVGLIIAIPLVVCQSAINIRISKLQDEVQQGLGRFLEAWDQRPKKQ